MSEFCTKCAQKEAEMEILNAKHYEEVKKLQEQIDSLSLDLAFYEGKIVNLSCNDK